MAGPDRFDPQRPDPDPEPVEQYGFAEPLEVSRPSVPIPEPGTDPDPVDDERPQRRKKKKKRPIAEESAEERPAKHRDRILEREELPPSVPWWTSSAVIAAIGLLFLLGPLIVLSSQNPAAGLVGFVVISLGTLVEVIGLTVMLFLLGSFFGIDYGPAGPAIVKLAALITFVNGQTLLVGVLCYSVASFLAILFAGILAGATAYGLFMFLFRLSVNEAMISVGGMVVASWLLNFAAMGILTAGR